MRKPHRKEDAACFCSFFTRCGNLLIWQCAADFFCLLKGVQHSVNQYEFFLASSLEKVFPELRPAPLDSEVCAWAGTRAAVQLVYRGPSMDQCGLLQTFRITVSGAPVQPEISEVRLIPSHFPCWESAAADDNYLTKAPGLFPDLLMPLQSDRFRPVPRQYRSLWLSFPIPDDAQPGTFEVKVQLEPDCEIKLATGEMWHSEFEVQPCTLTFRMKVGKAKLAPQTLIHTEWFYGDCLAEYYQVPALSEKHWRIMDNFIHAAAQRHGVNMILTPVFTPPLDTAVGGERPTVQLVGITQQNGRYTFDFSALERWTQICRDAGVEYLEIAHLFTQWGARATPKIMATVDGEKKRIFGWDVPADSASYRSFLEQFIPALRAELERLGYDRDHVYFHISDEPTEANLENYRTAKRQVQDLLEGCPVIDALSSLDFYRLGLVKHPITASDHIQPFLDAGVPDLWVYYCCAQGVDVPNRFYAMPSARNRIMGVLMYLNNIRGFLHWGYNFYFSQYSRETVDPYTMTHCNYAFPSGDPYLVYPGKDGQPLSSIRAEVQSEALVDLRALQTLEQYLGRDAVREIIGRNAGMETMTFKQYPTQAKYLLELRCAVFEALEKV